MMKLNRQTKIEVGKKIKKHQMKKVDVKLKSQMVAIPETEDAGGKPFFIQAIQFNKIWDKVKW